MRFEPVTLAPLLNAPLTTQLHATAALAALGLSANQLLGAKGIRPHRVLGSVWAVLMLGVALSSFWIHGIRQFGDFSLIHLLSIVVLVNVPLAVWAAHQHNVRRHRTIMLSMFWLALVGAGLFTLAPGRIMHQVVFGP